MSWPVVLASGGPRERGRAYGRQAADRVQRSLELYQAVFEHYAELPWSEARSRAGAFIDPIDAFDVQLLPEIEGIAEGAGLDAEDVLALNLRTEVMFGLDRRAARDAMKECTALAGVTGSGPIVAQNWDWKPSARTACVLLACAPEGRPGFVSLVEAGLLGKCGANEAGIALAVNALQSSLDRGEPGVPFHAVIRRVLTSASYDEAVAAVRDTHRASSANYLIGDRDGRSIDLEALPGGPADVSATTGTGLAHANHFVWPSPRPFKDLGRIDGEDSLYRHARAQTAADEGLTTDRLREVLSSHEDGENAVCVHEHPDIPPVEDYVTVGAFVADLGAGTVAVTEGNPCEADFEVHSVAELVGRSRASTSAAAERTGAG